MLNTVLNTQNKLDWNFTAQTDIHNDKTIELLSNDDIEKLQKIVLYRLTWHDQVPRIT